MTSRSETAPPATILIAEDDGVARKNLKRLLIKEGYTVEAFEDGDQAVLRLMDHTFDVVLTDLVMEPIGGLRVLERAKELSPETEVILMTGYATVATAVEAIKKGAFHYLQKPLRPDEVRHVVGLALEKRRLRSQVAALEREAATEATRIIGTSPVIAELRRLIQQVAPTDSNVLISGASGTGKELVAAAIHAQSSRHRERFVAVNCASLTDELVTNELFGHEKDAYTGATSKRPGLFEVASGGTLFFDEVGDMPPAMQAKLLRVVQEREVLRVGGSRPIKVDVRIISATNKDLKRAMEHGTFRSDLYYRLVVVPIEMPSLAQRREDIPLLAAHFLRRINRRSGAAFVGFSREALELLVTYDYPGNVRELENIVERAAALSRTEVLGPESLPADLRELSVASVVKSPRAIKTLAEIEMEHIQRALAAFDQNKTKAAAALGIDRVSLYRKLKKKQIRD